MSYNPTPPATISPKLKLDYITEFNQRLDESNKKELGTRLKTGLVVSLILSTIVVLTALGGYYAHASQMNGLQMTFTIVGIVLTPLFGITFATMIGIYLDLPAYREQAKQRNLNQVMQLEYQINAASVQIV